MVNGTYITMSETRKRNSFLVSLLWLLGYSFCNAEFVATAVSLDTDTLPEDWKQVCVVDVDSIPWKFDTLNTSQIFVHYLSCLPSMRHGISFSSFRNWTFGLPENETIAVSIRCANENATISLPWPFKANGLVYFKVDNCLILDFNSEMTNFQFTHIPDTLLYLELRNSRIYTNFETFENNILNLLDIDPDAECGSRVLETLVFHGVQYQQERIPRDIDEQRLSRLAAILAKNSRQLKHTCVYTNLREWSERRNGRKSRLFFQVVVENSQFPKLEIMDISNCNIGEIYKEFKVWRDHFPNMAVLNMSHNKISSFDFVGYGQKDEVGIIDLTYNNIDQITESDIKKMLLLKSATVELSGNPINCSCGQIQELFAFVNGDRSAYQEYAKYVNPKRYDYLQQLTCAFPPELTGIQIGDLTDDDITCKSSKYPRAVSISLISSLSVLVVVLATILVVSLKYRREIVIVVYTRLHVVLPCQPIESDIDDDRKTHDVFVSFSSLDAEWVYQTLVPRLERRNSVINKPGCVDHHAGLALCLHHRDFEVGIPIADNVVKSVESSRHTLLVLSRNFIESHWCVYEFRQALHQSIMEKKRHMVIVILDDIADKDLDPELRRCLKTFTYIRVGDPLFWDRLIYSVAKQCKINKAMKEVRRSPNPDKHPEHVNETLI